MKNKVHSFQNGYVIHASCMDESAIQFIRDTAGPLPLIVTDPPYGGIVSEYWDKQDDVSLAAFLKQFTHSYAELMVPGGAMYVWGGIGTPGNRAFFRYLLDTEIPGKLELSNVITWSKKRAYGVQHNYLFTREECAYWVVGDRKKPHHFQVPLLDQLRGYAGYDAKYPAKSDYLRRTNVWTDITEMFQNKVHPTQKPTSLYEIPILAHTLPGEYVVDPFAGSGTAAIAAIKTGRKFIVIEQDARHVSTVVERIKQFEAEFIGQPNAQPTI